jgi:hypothetical protein
MSSRTTSGWVAQSSSSQAALKASPIAVVASGSNAPCLVIREMRDDDARSFLEVHHAAARRIAVRDYPPEVIEAWAPVPITRAAVEAVIAIPEDEVRFVAERDGHIIGLACLVIGAKGTRSLSTASTYCVAVGRWLV